MNPLRRSQTNRRHFLQTAGLSAAALGIGAPQLLAQESAAEPPKNAIPRWRGFNLLNFFQAFSRGGRCCGPSSDRNSVTILTEVPT